MYLKIEQQNSNGGIKKIVHQLNQKIDDELYHLMLKPTAQSPTDQLLFYNTAIFLAYKY